MKKRRKAVRKDKVILIRVTEAQKATLAETAEKAGLGLSSWLLSVALREVQPSHMVLLRFAVASVAALPFALAGAEARALFRSPPVLLAGVFYGLAFMVQFEGLAGVTVTLAALLVGAMPALIAVAAHLMGERVSRASWTGVAAATIGAGLIAGGAVFGLLALGALTAGLIALLDKAMATWVAALIVMALWAIVALVLQNIKPGTTKSGGRDRSRFTLDDTVRDQARRRVDALLASYPVYPEIDLAFLQESLGKA